LAPDPEKADFVLINTCSVRITAENRAWGRISHYAALKKRKPFWLIVAGCMAERLKIDMRERQPAIDCVLSNYKKDSLIDVLESIETEKPIEASEESPVFRFALNHHEPGSFRSFVPIMHGCNNFCSYCIVPYLRGREVSRSPDAILAEIDQLNSAGTKEITLLGQNVNSYAWNVDGDSLKFPGLLVRVIDRLKTSKDRSIRWLRFLTSHPKDMSTELIDIMRKESLLCRHIHLCVQHGSDRILKAMNRAYTRSDYLKLVDAIKKALPDATISTDILIGFPGENEDDVASTLDLMREVGFIYSFMYHFNPREGTPAASLPEQVPAAVKKERLARVIALQKELSAQCMQGLIGTTTDVLIESVSKRKRDEVLGRTQADMTVVFPCAPSRVGTFASVKLLALTGHTFKGEECS
jgi:tRNA-2-methylthio-N6-dimethylallyladenosine synthase